VQVRKGLVRLVLVVGSVVMMMVGGFLPVEDRVRQAFVGVSGDLLPGRDDGLRQQRQQDNKRKDNFAHSSRVAKQGRGVDNRMHLHAGATQAQRIGNHGSRAKRLGLGAKRDEAPAEHSYINLGIRVAATP